MKLRGSIFDKTLTAIGALSLAGLLAVLTLAIVTMWATGRSMERTGCYRTATTVEQCGSPSQLERLLASVIGPNLN